MKPLVVLSSLLAAASAAAPPTPKPTTTSYDGYKVFRVPIRTKTQRVNDVVNKLSLGYWQPAQRKGAFADIQVPPGQLDAFYREMDGFELITMHEDLGKSMAGESTSGAYAAGSANDTWFSSYHAYEDHLRWLQDLQAKFPNNSEVVTSGKSFEGNDITGIE